MIDLFAILGKGGILLWYFQAELAEHNFFESSINRMINDVLMQQRGDVKTFQDNNSTFKFHLDNEFDLVFVVMYQTIVQLSYGEHLLTEASIRFRDLYKNVLSDAQVLYEQRENLFTNFSLEFERIFTSIHRDSLKDVTDRRPRSFRESNKAHKAQKTSESASALTSRPVDKNLKTDAPHNAVEGREPPEMAGALSYDNEVVERRKLMAKKILGNNVSTVNKCGKASAIKKSGKENRKWSLEGNSKELAQLDFSETSAVDNDVVSQKEKADDIVDESFIREHKRFVGRSAQLLNIDSLNIDAEEKENEEKDSKASSGWLNSLRNLVGSKKITESDLSSVLEKMKETLILRNVAAEPANQICNSVARKLDGKVIGTFTRIKTEVREATRDALTQLLSPKRRVDILRDVAQAKSECRPYVIVMCGVNGVGKSTNLAKICFWLNENGHRVLVAAGDTFRAGAVEQLRTHTRHLNALHPNSVQLFEQGYGKDPASLAAAAIAIAVERQVDVVLVDTAGRMQDNEPLMRALAKLIRVNEPDLCLFVGEALVGNEAVDQLVKFNQALADNSTPGQTPRLIDGIVLTKFDTIDDKVGAAVSMTYITGQPVVFVGCGQTYTDLRTLNVDAVVTALLR